MKTRDGQEAEYYPLDREVLAVAVQGRDRTDWAAYVGAVPGNSHDREWEQVAKTGGKLPYHVAIVLFPRFDRKYTWRS